jgi:UDP-N-acetylmuramoyl-tripeptide--D-alanyl-D-alanine ligase
MTILFLALLTVAASISPLATFAALWQIKEWRTDRLREHLRSEGILRQLFGIARPATIAMFGIAGSLHIIPQHEWPSVTLAALLTVAALQLILRRHPHPVWTKKAQALFITSMLLTFLAALTTNMYTLPLLPLLQPFFLLVALLLWSPVDTLLKNRVMQRARTVRNGRPELTVIGITGSVGKTTTKELLAHILKEQNILFTPEHINTEMGVSQWFGQALLSHPEVEVVVVEMGAYRSGEIALLCSIVQPTLGVVSFIGRQHIGLFGSQESLCSAKAELLDALPKTGHAFMNADSSLCREIIAHAACPVTMVGTGGHADMEAFDIDETSHGLQFRIGDTACFVPMHGTHNITNILLAVAVAEHLGISRERIAERLRSYRPAQHTFSVREESGITILDDTHNTSPTSFKAAIAWAKIQPFEHKVLLTSGLMELGEEQDRAHAELGTLAAGIFHRVIFLNRKNARPFARGYGQSVELPRKGGKIPSVQQDTLLVCVGRMPEHVIQSLLP